MPTNTAPVRKTYILH